MIGALIESYCLGRRDAQAGRPKRDRSVSDGGRAIQCYRTGYNDERRRMCELGKLPQLEFDFSCEGTRRRG
jgi:hypothetical protein